MHFQPGKKSKDGTPAFGYSDPFVQAPTLTTRETLRQFRRYAPLTDRPRGRTRSLGPRSGCPRAVTSLFLTVSEPRLDGWVDPAERWKILENALVFFPDLDFCGVPGIPLPQLGIPRTLRGLAPARPLPLPLPPWL